MNRWSRKKELIKWRRDKAIELTCKGHTQAEIAKILQVGAGTVNRDLSYFRDRLKENMEKYLEKILEEHDKSIIGLDYIIRESWSVASNTNDYKQKLHALSLAKDCYLSKDRLLYNIPLLSQILNLSDSEPQLGKTKDKSVQSNNLSSPSSGADRKKYGVKRSEEQDRESQERITNNKTF